MRKLAVVLALSLNLHSAVAHATTTTTSTTTTLIVPSICGDGTVGIDEDCDDGNVAASDGCDSSCLAEAGWTCIEPGVPCVSDCGDGLLVGDEACDDGNLNNCDGCSSLCYAEQSGLSWCFAGGPEGGPVLAIAIDPSDSAIVYAGTNAGVFKSTDAGQTWGSANGGTSMFSVNVLAIDPHNPATVMAAAVAGYAGPGVPAGVSRSTDGGISWTKLPYSTYSGASLIVFDPTNSGVAYMGGGGLFKSLDAGQSWAPLEGMAVPVRALALDPSATTTLYAASTTVVMKSLDGGTSWQSADQGLPAGVCQQKCSLAVDPATPSVVYLGAAGFLYRTTDGGDNWSTLSIPNGCSPGYVAFDPTDPTNLYAGSCRSADAGMSWTPLADSIAPMAIDPDRSGAVYAGTPLGFLHRQTVERPGSRATTGCWPRPCGLSRSIRVSQVECTPRPTSEHGSARTTARHGRQETVRSV
jgi:cysteine-rich repeat protein